MRNLILLFFIVFINLINFINATEPSESDSVIPLKNSKVINRSPQSIITTSEKVREQNRLPSEFQSEFQSKMKINDNSKFTEESYRKRERLLASNSGNVKKEESSFSILLLGFLALLIPLGLFWSSKKP